MAIKTIRPRLPRLGMIRLGEKAVGKNGREYPVNSQHFVFPKPGEAGYELLRGRYDERTDVLNVHFPLDEVDALCSDYYRLYTASGLQCRGDGETGVYAMFEPRTDTHCRPYVHKEMAERDCAGRGCSHAESGECKPSALLSFCLSDVHALGVWQLSTRSLAAIRQFRAVLELAKASVGRISGLPFQLYRYPLQVAPDGRRKTVMAVGLRLDPSARVERHPALMEGEVSIPVETVVEEMAKEAYTPVGESDWAEANRYLWEAACEACRGFSREAIAQALSDLIANTTGATSSRELPANKLRQLADAIKEENGLLRTGHITDIGHSVAS